MTIEVTQEDIDYGAIDCRRCPMALAIIRATGLKDIRVMSSGIVRVWDHNWPLPDVFREVPLPEVACQFRKNFDYKGRAFVKPFSFELSI